MGGATFPAEANILRILLPESIFLVPGYGAQGATKSDVIPCFNSAGLGAVVNASRSITYGFKMLDISSDDLVESVRNRTKAMIADISNAIAQKNRSENSG